jgi:hypothetical protein
MPCLSDAAIRAASHQGDIGSGVLEGDELAARGASGIGSSKGLDQLMLQPLDPLSRRRALRIIR